MSLFSCRISGKLLGLCKIPAKFISAAQSRTVFRQFSKKTNYGLPYPQKPGFRPLTLHPTLLRVCNRVAIFSFASAAGEIGRHGLNRSRS